MPIERGKSELLAPAGGWEQLRYALHFGADAVYFACDRFGMRHAAQNFPLEEVPRAVDAVHKAGAKAYVALNIYFHEADLAELPRYVRAVANAGADAVLVSDLGALSVVREVAPGLPIHISTQASVSNAAAARAFYELGARRVVCAREMSLAEIAELRAGIPDDMEIEAFVHGAMCMAVSGRCLISDFLAGRPANQGNCTQPCRWDYTLHEPKRPGQEFPIVEEGGLTHLLSSKDMNMLAHLDALRQAGIDSLKIEGRAKTAFYVASVVNAYRHVLDGEPASTWEPELDAVSHRPYSTGFYFGPAEQYSSGPSYERRYDWVGVVLACRRVSVERWHIEARCRNRFFQGDELEVLSPHMPVRSVRVEGLAELVEVEGACGPAREPVAVLCQKANKTMVSYVFETDTPLAKHDILRRRRDVPSKNAG